MIRQLKSVWKKLLCLSLSIFLGVGILAGCDSKTGAADDSKQVFYYINQAGTAVVSEETSMDYADDAEAMAEKVIEKMKENTNNVNILKPIPDNITLDRYEMESGIVTLYFAAGYNDMPNDQEVLHRAAIVYNLVQVDGIDGVRFMVDDTSLRDAKGRPVGVMTKDSFVDDPAKDINNIQTAEITLYFANSDGTGLVKQPQVAHYNSNVPIEKMIMEQLLLGPDDAQDMQSAIPEGTNLISVSVMDGVCFVSLDSGFMNPNFAINSDVVVYSIVNSLMELSNVNMVQISVNGKTDMSYRDEMPLSEYYTSNYDLVVAVEEKKEETEVSPETDTENAANIILDMKGE